MILYLGLAVLGTLVWAAGIWAWARLYPRQLLGRARGGTPRRTWRQDLIPMLGFTLTVFAGVRLQARDNWGGWAFLMVATLVFAAHTVPIRLHNRRVRNLLKTAEI